MRAECQSVSIPEPHQRVISSAKLAGAFNDGIEHWLNIGRRGGDHAQDVGAAGLMGKCFSKITGALTQLPKQSCVFDGNHGLSGEVF